MGPDIFKKLCRLAGETCVRYRLISDGDGLSLRKATKPDGWIGGKP